MSTWNRSSQLRIRRGKSYLNFNGPSWTLIVLAVIIAVLVVLLC
jgi:hypothetical protein